MSSTKRRKVIEYYWYIVDLIDLRDPRLLMNHFPTKSDAKKALRKYLTNNVERFDIVSGKKAIKYNMKFVATKRERRKGKVRPGAIRLHKYKYPDHVKTRKQRKSIRTMIRRKQRAGTLKGKRHQNTINELKR